MSGASGVVDTRDKHRNLNRIFITVLCVFFLVALVGVPLYFHLRANQSVPTPCHQSLSVPLFSPIFHPNGSVVDGDDVYPPGYHFTANGTTRGCLCVLKPCVRKCCAKDEYYVKVPNHLSRCEKAPGSSPFDNFSLPVHKTPGEQVKVDQDHFQILYGDVCLHGKYVLDSKKYPDDKDDIFVDEKLRIIVGDSYLDASNYCFESMNGSEDVRTLLCFGDPTVDIETEVQFLLYPIGMTVSTGFLIATIIVYSILPELRNLHGKSLVCQCSCLLIAYLSLAIIQFKIEILNFWCVFLAFMIQFMFLGSFFWLNVMSFDVWWAFSGLRPANWGLKATEHKKFLLYSLYAWGVPFVIVTISVGMDMIPDISDSYIKPRFGERKCWFADDTGTFIYFYLPSGIVLVLNIIMFVTTAFKLRSHTKNDRDKVRFRLYLRLFITMGLNWILELVSFFVGGPKSLWFVTDLCNTLQGVIIFFFFVCKRGILQKLNKKLCPSCKLFRETSPEYSKSLSTSISLTKIEIDDLDLKSQDDNNESKHEDTQPKATQLT